MQFLARPDALLLDEPLRLDDVSRAWLVWSGSAEAALADACRFPGGPVPVRGLVLGRGSARFRVVRSGGPKVRKTRSNVADVREASDVFMHRDSSIAPVLDLRRRTKAVMDAHDSVFRSGVSRARSVELTVQWEKILRTGPVYPVILHDLQSVRDGGVREFRRVTGDLHCRLTDFVHGVVVHRRDGAIGGWRN